MREHLSVFSLMAKATLHKILLLLLVMAAAEAGMFYLAMHMDSDGEMRQLETIIGDAHMGLIFFAAFLCMIVILGGSFSGSKSRQQYTLQRLRISERQVFLWQSLYNAFAYLLLWAVQIIVSLLLCRFFVQTVSTLPLDSGFAEVNGQTVFLAFYRNDFLHSILPLESWPFWIRNVVLVCSLGIATAYSIFLSRRGKGSIAFSILGSLTAVSFMQPLDGALLAVLLTIAVLLIMAVILQKVIFWKEETYEE